MPQVYHEVCGLCHPVLRTNRPPLSGRRLSRLRLKGGERPLDAAPCPKQPHLLQSRGADSSVSLPHETPRNHLHLVTHLRHQRAESACEFGRGLRWPLRGSLGMRTDGTFSRRQSARSAAVRTASSIPGAAGPLPRPGTQGTARRPAQAVFRSSESERLGAFAAGQRPPGSSSSVSKASGSICASPSSS